MRLHRGKALLFSGYAISLKVNQKGIFTCTKHEKDMDMDKDMWQN